MNEQENGFLVFRVFKLLLEGLESFNLAIQVALDLQDLFEDGAYLVALEPISDPTGVIPAIGETLGIRQPAGGPLVDEILRISLRSKHILLLLDNFEHLLEGVDLILEILKSSPGVKILVTSRSRLNLQEECLYPVEGLSYPATSLHLPEAALQYGSVQLFLEGARRVRPDFIPEGHAWPT